jgi:hypothetical protein
LSSSFDISANAVVATKQPTATNVSIFIFLSQHRFSAIAVPIDVGQEGLNNDLIDRIVRAFLGSTLAHAFSVDTLRDRQDVRLGPLLKSARRLLFISVGRMNA